MFRKNWVPSTLIWGQSQSHVTKMEGLVPEKEEIDFIYIFQRVVGNLSEGIT